MADPTSSSSYLFAHSDYQHHHQHHHGGDGPGGSTFLKSSATFPTMSGPGPAGGANQGPWNNAGSNAYGRGGRSRHFDAFGDRAAPAGGPGPAQGPGGPSPGTAPGYGYEGGPAAAWGVPQQPSPASDKSAALSIGSGNGGQPPQQQPPAWGTPVGVQQPQQQGIPGHSQQHQQQQQGQQQQQHGGPGPEQGPSTGQRGASTSGGVSPAKSAASTPSARASHGAGSVSPPAGADGNAGGANHNGSVGGGQKDDELIPTAIVIKNIPFAIKKEQLLEVMTSLGLPIPYAFNYHFDNGVFRGLAFANFTTPEETGAVIQNLNGREIGGRKLRVEYKKMLPLAERERIEREKRERRGQLEEQHRSQPKGASPMGAGGPHHHHAAQNHGPAGGVAHPPHGQVNGSSRVDLNDPETLEFYSQLLLFRDDKLRNELAFPVTLLPHQRKIVSVLASQLALHVIEKQGAGGVGPLLVTKQPPVASSAGGPPPGIFEYGQVHQPQPHYPVPHMNVQPYGFPQQHQQHQQGPSAAAGYGAPPAQLRGTKSFADIRNPVSYPYQMSNPGTPSGSPFFTSQTPPPPPPPMSKSQVQQAQGPRDGQSQQGLPPLSLGLQQSRGGHYFGQTNPGYQPVHSQFESASHMGGLTSSITSLTDSFSSVMSLGGTPIGRTPSSNHNRGHDGTARAAPVGANSNADASSSPTASIHSHDSGCAAGVIGSNVTTNTNAANDSNEPTS